MNPRRDSSPVLLPIEVGGPYRRDTSLGKDAQRGKDYLLPVGEHVVVALANRKETLQGTLQNVVFHEDGTIAALLVQAGKSTYVPWHSVLALARDPGSDFEAGIFD